MQPGDDRRAERGGLKQSRLDAVGTQDVDEILRERQLVARWIRRVEADQCAQMLDRLARSDDGSTRP
jgi:hypothetical protein